MLQLRNVTVRRSGRTIVDGVNLDWSPGERLLLTGPSGGGKSTLLSVILLFPPPSSGELLWNGSSVTPADLLQYRRNFMYVGQKPMFFEGTVAEFLDLPYTFSANGEQRPDRGKQDEWLRRFRLEPSMRSGDFSTLSGGERQRVTLVQGLQLERPFCLLDEVTSSLDPDSMQTVIEEFAQPGRTVLAIAHNREWQQAGFDEWRMEDGILRRRP